MPKTLEDWKTLYYEQQALHTEARGMLCQERDGWKTRAERAEEAYENMRAWAQANGIDTAARPEGGLRLAADCYDVAPVTTELPIPDGGLKP